MENNTSIQRGVESKKTFFEPLTGIRAIAAWWVFLFHFNPLNTSNMLGGMINHLYIGVDVFFVLSGFLICYRYYDSISINRKWISKYVVNRFARIYPIYFILTTLTFMSQFFSSVSTSKYSLFQISKHIGFEYFMNLTFLKSFFYDLRFTGIPQGWTLTVEECFYFLAPFIFIMLPKIKLIFQTIIFLAIGIILVELLGGETNYGFFKDYQFMLIFTFFGRAFEFFVGIKLGLVILSNKKIKWLKGYATGIGVIGFILMLFILSVYSQYLFPPYGRIYLASYILPLIIFILFYGLITEKTLLSRILSLRFMILFGRSSYVFYLVHMGIFQIFIENHLSKSILVSFILLNIIAIYFFKLIEEPLNVMIRNTHSNHLKK